MSLKRLNEYISPPQRLQCLEVLEVGLALVTEYLFKQFMHRAIGSSSGVSKESAMKENLHLGQLAESAQEPFVSVNVTEL